MIELTDEELAKGREIYGDCRCEYPIMTDSEWESELYRMIVLDKHLTEELRKEIDKEIEKAILIDGELMKSDLGYRAIEMSQLTNTTYTKEMAYDLAALKSMNDEAEQIMLFGSNNLDSFGLASEKNENPPNSPSK